MLLAGFIEKVESRLTDLVVIHLQKKQQKQNIFGFNVLLPNDRE